MLADDLEDVYKIFYGQLQRFFESKFILKVTGQQRKQEKYAGDLEELTIGVGTTAVRGQWKQDKTKCVFRRKWAAVPI